MRRHFTTAVSGFAPLALLGALMLPESAFAQQGENIYGRSTDDGYGEGYGGYYYSNGGGYYPDFEVGNVQPYYFQGNLNQSYYPGPVGRTGWQTRADGWQYYWSRNRVVGAYDPDGNRWYPYTPGTGWARPTTPPWQGR